MGCLDHFFSCKYTEDMNAQQWNAREAARLFPGNFKPAYQPPPTDPLLEDFATFYVKTAKTESDRKIAVAFETASAGISTDLVTRMLNNTNVSTQLDGIINILSEPAPPASNARPASGSTKIGFGRSSGGGAIDICKTLLCGICMTIVTIPGGAVTGGIGAFFYITGHTAAPIVEYCCRNSDQLGIFCGVGWLAATVVGIGSGAVAGAIGAVVGAITGPIASVCATIQELKGQNVEQLAGRSQKPQNKWVSTGHKRLIRDGSGCKRTLFRNPAKPGELRIRRMVVRGGKRVASYVKL